MSNSSQTEEGWEQGCNCKHSTSTEPMVACDIEYGCGKWWHHVCVDYSIETVDRIKYICCPKCFEAGLGPSDGRR